MSSLQQASGKDDGSNGRPSSSRQSSATPTQPRMVSLRLQTPSQQLEAHLSTILISSSTQSQPSDTSRYTPPSTRARATRDNSRVGTNVSVDMTTRSSGLRGVRQTPPPPSTPNLRAQSTPPGQLIRQHQSPTLGGKIGSPAGPASATGVTHTRTLSALTPDNQRYINRPPSQQGLIPEDQRNRITDTVAHVNRDLASAQISIIFEGRYHTIPEMMKKIMTIPSNQLLTFLSQLEQQLKRHDESLDQSSNALMTAVTHRIRQLNVDLVKVQQAAPTLHLRADRHRRYTHVTAARKTLINSKWVTEQFLDRVIIPLTSGSTAIYSEIGREVRGRVKPFTLLYRAGNMRFQRLLRVGPHQDDNNVNRTDPRIMPTDLRRAAQLPELPTYDATNNEAGQWTMIFEFSRQMHYVLDGCGIFWPGYVPDDIDDLYRHQGQPAPVTPMRMPPIQSSVYTLRGTSQEEDFLAGNPPREPSVELGTQPMQSRQPSCSSPQEEHARVPSNPPSSGSGVFSQPTSPLRDGSDASHGGDEALQSIEEEVDTPTPPLPPPGRPVRVNAQRQRDQVTHPTKSRPAVRPSTRSRRPQPVSTGPVIPSPALSEETSGTPSRSPHPPSVHHASPATPSTPSLKRTADESMVRSSPRPRMTETRDELITTEDGIKQLITQMSGLSTLLRTNSSPSNLQQVSPIPMLPLPQANRFETAVLGSIGRHAQAIATRSRPPAMSEEQARDLLHGGNIADLTTTLRRVVNVIVGANQQNPTLHAYVEGAIQFSSLLLYHARDLYTNAEDIRHMIHHLSQNYGHSFHFEFGSRQHDGYVGTMTPADFGELLRDVFHAGLLGDQTVTTAINLYQRLHRVDQAPTQASSDHYFLVDLYQFCPRDLQSYTEIDEIVKTTSETKLPPPGSAYDPLPHLIVPVCIPGHWSLLTVDTHRNEYNHFDSGPRNPDADHRRRFLFFRLQNLLSIHPSYRRRAFTEGTARSEQQEGSSDSGLWVIENARRFIQRDTQHRADAGRGSELRRAIADDLFQAAIGVDRPRDRPTVDETILALQHQILNRQREIDRLQEQRRRDT